MASMLFKFVRICNSQFKCNYRKKDKHFLNFLLRFLNLHQILNILKKKMIVIVTVFPKLQTVNILVRPLSKKRRFRTRLEIEHVKARWKTCEISMRALLSCFFLIPREVSLQNVSPSVRWNLRVVCEHMNIWWQVSRSRLWEFATPNSNAIIWKTINIFWIFYSISWIYIKFQGFSKKDDSHS